MKRFIHAPTIVALLVAAACDTQGDELDRELDVAAEEEDADEDSDEELGGPEALQSQLDPAGAIGMRVEYSGPCSDAADRTGLAVLWIHRGGGVRGQVFDDSYPGERILLSGGVSGNGSFEAIESTPFGECTWTGLVDIKRNFAHGGWDCGHGCAGDWSN